MSGEVVFGGPLRDVPGSRPPQISALGLVQEAEVSRRQDALGYRVGSRLLVVWLIALCRASCLRAFALVLLSLPHPPGIALSIVSGIFRIPPKSVRDLVIVAGVSDLAGHIARIGHLQIPRQCFHSIWRDCDFSYHNHQNTAGNKPFTDGNGPVFEAHPSCVIWN